MPLFRLLKIQHAPTRSTLKDRMWLLKSVSCERQGNWKWSRTQFVSPKKQVCSLHIMRCTEEKGIHNKYQCTFLICPFSAWFQHTEYGLLSLPCWMPNLVCLNQYSFLAETSWLYMNVCSYSRVSLIIFIYVRGNPSGMSWSCEKLQAIQIMPDTCVIYNFIYWPFVTR